MIDPKDWRWRGMPGHLIVSENCCFHLVTDIGGCKVSTIGCYHRHGVEKNYETRSPVGGSDELYETYVFAAKDGEITDLCEIVGVRYAEEKDAEAGHARWCRIVAECDGDPQRVAESEET